MTDKLLHQCCVRETHSQAVLAGFALCQRLIESMINNAVYHCRGMIPLADQPPNNNWQIELMRMQDTIKSMHVVISDEE